MAETDGKLVGCVMLCRTENPLTGQLRLFLVEKEYRRFGIGGALIRALMDKAKESGYKELILWTAIPPKDAIRHYERLGFHVVEEKENPEWSLDGESVVEVKMTRPEQGDREHMREIKVVIDEGGIFQGLYVTPGLEDCNVELIDFVTDVYFGK